MTNSDGKERNWFGVMRSGFGLVLALVTLAGVALAISPFLFHLHGGAVNFCLGAGIGVAVTGLVGLVAYVPATLSSDRLDRRVGELTGELDQANDKLDAITADQKRFADAAKEDQVRTAFLSNLDHSGGGSFADLRLVGATLRNLKLGGVQLSRLDWKDVIVLDGVWTDVEATSARFGHCSLVKLVITGGQTQLNNATFTNSVLNQVRVEPEAGQRSPNLQFVKVEGGLLWNVSFQAEMRGVQFVPQAAEQADAGGAALGPQFEGATYRRCDLTEARFERTNFDNGPALFEDCTFESAQLLELKCGPLFEFRRCLFRDVTITSRRVDDPAASAWDPFLDEVTVKFVECLFGDCDLTGWTRKSEYTDCLDARSRWNGGARPERIRDFGVLSAEQQRDFLGRVGLRTSGPHDADDSLRNT